MFCFLLDRLPNDFAFGVLSDLVESYDHIPEKLLLLLFGYGDSACNVSICLKTDLSERLMQQCRESQDPNVVEHFSRRR